MKKPKSIKKKDIINYWINVCGYDEYETDYKWDDMTEKMQIDCISRNE